MKKEVYNARLDPEIKDQWEKLLDDIKEREKLATVGDVYPILINLISSDRSFITADLNGYITAIRTNLDAILQNVLSIDSVYKSSLDNQEQALQQAKATLQAHLEQEIKKNKALADELDKTNQELDQAKELIGSLEAENQRLKENQNIQDKMLKILEQLQENSKEETATDPDNET